MRRTLRTAPKSLVTVVELTDTDETDLSDDTMDVELDDWEVEQGTKVAGKGAKRKGATNKSPLPCKKVKRPQTSRERRGKQNVAQKQDLTNNKQNSKINDANTAGASCSVNCNDWTEVEYLVEENNIDKHVAENLVKLFDGENTIPFIARYRKNMTGGMEPDKLRAVKESFDLAKRIKERASAIIKSIDKLGKWTAEDHSAIVSAKSLEDLEHIYSFFKPAQTRSLAERARQSGLGPVAESLLKGATIPLLNSLVDPNKEFCATEEKVRDGIICLVADIVSKNEMVFKTVKKLQESSIITVQTSECKSTSSKKKEKEATNRSKYEMYFSFSSSVKNIKSHQILAINRAEAQKIINVKVVVPITLAEKFKDYCGKRYKTARWTVKWQTKLFNDSVDYAYAKFIKPLIVRRVRAEMRQRAETDSIEVFVKNVKELLLISPVRGKVILGIDPGFHHGCKLAVISKQGDVLETAVIYPHRNSAKSSEAANTLIRMINTHKCTVVALGGATASRETESFLSELIKSGAFHTNISYTVVDESGASIYSCSPEAKAEFPEMDPNMISAVSIARRLQDPLAELVKVEPKHLGVGMYQHDLQEKKLLGGLNEVVSEAVSFVGVDVNTASFSLLKRVAGLNASRANSIIEWRTKEGLFKNRQELLQVRGIGSKTFEQCAGFIRIQPETFCATKNEKSKGKSGINLLDQTWIHPESYKIANDFLAYCKCDIKDLGTPAFIEKIKTCTNEEGNANLARKFSTNETTIDVIIEGLSMKKHEDIRFNGKQPLFLNNMRNIKDLTAGMKLSGAVRNVTHFGTFVDVGVQCNGLIPTKWGRNQNLSVGDRVEVEVSSVELQRNRIGLKLIRVL